MSAFKSYSSRNAPKCIFCSCILRRASSKTSSETSFLGLEEEASKSPDSSNVSRIAVIPSEASWFLSKLPPGNTCGYSPVKIGCQAQNLPRTCTPPKWRAWGFRWTRRISFLSFTITRLADGRGTWLDELEDTVVVLVDIGRNLYSKRLLGWSRVLLNKLGDMSRWTRINGNFLTETIALSSRNFTKRGSIRSAGDVAKTGQHPSFVGPAQVCSMFGREAVCIIDTWWRVGVQVKGANLKRVTIAFRANGDQGDNVRGT